MSCPKQQPRSRRSGGEEDADGEGGLRRERIRGQAGLCERESSRKPPIY